MNTCMHACAHTDTIFSNLAVTTSLTKKFSILCSIYSYECIQLVVLKFSRKINLSKNHNLPHICISPCIYNMYYISVYRCIYLSTGVYICLQVYIKLYVCVHVYSYSACRLPYAHVYQEYAVVIHQDTCESGGGGDAPNRAAGELPTHRQ